MWFDSGGGGCGLILMMSVVVWGGGGTSFSFLLILMCSFGDGLLMLVMAMGVQCGWFSFGTVGLVSLAMDLSWA
jgi:hypothetical protein